MRDSSIELYRVLLMLGICVLHSITKCGHTNAYLADALKPCVVGFVFISGWYGVRFSMRKLLKLYGLVAYASFVILLLGLLLGRIDGSLLQFWVRNFRGYWFVNSYAILMMLAPLVDYVIDDMDTSNWRNSKAFNAIIPLLILVFIWGGLRTLPYFMNILPEKSAPGPYSGYSLLGIYLAARLTRKFDFGTTISTSKLIITIIICELGCAFGLGEYTSPVSLIVAGGLFLLIKRMQVAHRVGGVVVFIAPSLFVIYLLHDNFVAQRLMTTFQEWFYGNVTGMLAYIATGVVVFFSCLAIDLPRRLILMGIALFRDNNKS